jgi:hypothetical protein
MSSWRSLELYIQEKFRVVNSHLMSLLQTIHELELYIIVDMVSCCDVFENINNE